jgi:hypothetical protein
VPGAGFSVGTKYVGQDGDQVVKNAVHARLAETEQRGQCSGGRVGAQLDKAQQDTPRLGQTPRPSLTWWCSMSGQGLDGA